MHSKKRQKHYNSLLVLMLLFNILAQAAIPAVAYASELEDTPTLTAAEVTPLTVSGLINLGNPDTKPTVTVEGYIVGFVQNGPSVSRESFGKTNYAIADSPDETNIDNMVFVQLQNNDFRPMFNLEDNI